MKIHLRIRSAGRALAVLLLCGGSLALAGSTAFFYQGRLADGTAPAAGLYDFQFRLFDTPLGGVPLGLVVTNEDLPVINGLFNVALDFGREPFTGTNLWLEIGVRPYNVTNAFTNVAPRQPLLPTPYAIHAMSADLAAVASQVNWSNMVGVPAFLAGPGLILGASNEFIVDFAGTGSSNKVARSDHQHLGQTWTSTTNLGLKITLTSPGGIDSAMWGQANSTNGRGVFGWAAATNGTNFGVHGLTSSARGIGVLGEATNSSGIGVMARGSGTNGTALAITNGAIRVPGARQGSTTPVFIHRVMATNLVFGNRYSVINHPMCNGDSNAMLFVTQNLNPSDPTGTNTSVNMQPVLVVYTGTNPDFAPLSNRWAIFNTFGPFITDVPVNAAFNVLIIKP